MGTPSGSAASLGSSDHVHVSRCSACMVTDPHLLEGSALLRKSSTCAQVTRVRGQRQHRQDPRRPHRKGRKGPGWDLSVWAAPGIPGGSRPLAGLPAPRQPDYSPGMLRAAGLHFPGFSARGGQDWACAGPGVGRGRSASRERGKSGSLPAPRPEHEPGS